MGRKDNPPDYEMKWFALTLGTPGSAGQLSLSTEPHTHCIQDGAEEQKRDVGNCILEAHLQCILEHSSILFTTSICVRRNRRGEQGSAVPRCRKLFSSMQVQRPPGGPSVQLESHTQKLLWLCNDTSSSAKHMRLHCLSAAGFAWSAKNVPHAGLLLFLRILKYSYTASFPSHQTWKLLISHPL